ncbi:hypothetical protein RYX56_21955, partial [Alkalihalophilus lindianensis]
LLNAGIGTDIINIKNKNTICSIYLTASNLTDISYQNHLSRLKYVGGNIASRTIGIYNPGRNFTIKLNIPMQQNKN